MPQQERWQVGGNAAEIYQRALVPAVFGPWAPRVVELAALRPGLRVLDIAGGTGLVARLAAEAVGVDGHVAALDLNPGMLAVAAELPTVEGAEIEWVEGTAQALPFAEASFDVVCCQLGLQFFSDREGALREMKRVLVPGGRAVVMVWREIDRAPGFAVLAAALARTISSDAEGSCERRSRSATPASYHGCWRRLASATVRYAPKPGRSTSPRRRCSSAATSEVTACRVRCDGSGTGLRKACERGRACPRPAHRAGHAVLPDRGASGALPRSIARLKIALGCPCAVNDPPGGAGRPAQPNAAVA
jgi:SAM-dependent methyltransferase